MLFGRLLAERGFQAVVQSCRGTFGSGGTFDPFGDERTDGIATIAWLREQPFYPGSFATAGPSYLGFTQWAIAGLAGDEHRRIAAQVTTAALHHMIYAGGSMSWATMLSWMQDMERQQGRFSLLRRIGGAGRLRRALRTLPLSAADRVASGAPGGVFPAVAGAREHRRPLLADPAVRRRRRGRHHAGEPGRRLARLHAPLAVARLRRPA